MISLTPVGDWNELFDTTLKGERSEKPRPPSVDTMFPFTVSTFPVVLTSHTLVLSCSTTAHGPGYQRLSKVSLQVQPWWGTYWYSFSIPRQDSGACTLSLRPTKESIPAVSQILKVTVIQRLRGYRWGDAERFAWNSAMTCFRRFSVHSKAAWSTCRLKSATLSDGIKDRVHFTTFASRPQSKATKPVR